jgi:hypothetical protein
MAKRIRADYEQLIRLVYDGYTAEGIGAIIGKSPANISSMLTEIKLLFKHIRAAKRDGKTLGAVMGLVDWTFLDKKAEAYASRGQNLKKPNAENAVSLAKEIAEIKAMVTEIYSALTSPVAEHKPTLMSRVTGLRN